MICYADNCNAILAHPIKNRSAIELLQAYQHFYTKLCSTGLVPQMHKWDNEMSADYKEFIVTQNAVVEYVQPDNHRINIAKWAIQTWKNRFTAGLSSLPKSFPITYCCWFIDQVNISLNLLQKNLANLHTKHSMSPSTCKSIADCLLYDTYFYRPNLGTAIYWSRLI